jgi:hypothetical protein
MNPKGMPQNMTRKGMGRPKGVKNKCTKAKEEYFRAFFQLGGIKYLKQELKESKRSRGKYLLDTLPSLMPKKTELDQNISGSLLIKIKGKRDDNEPSGSPSTTGS